MKQLTSLKAWLVTVVGWCLAVAVGSWLVSSYAVDGSRGAPLYTMCNTQFLQVIIVAMKQLTSFKAWLVTVVGSCLVVAVGSWLVSSYAVDGSRGAPLYIITPTHRRPEQIPELTRVSQTLMHVPNLHWLVVEDQQKSVQVTQLLMRTGISFEHLVAPKHDSLKNKSRSDLRGVSSRNRGLQWLRANATTGVFYFADDENTYDVSLFQEMRNTKRVSMWPVGLCTWYGLCSPIVRNRSFAGFYVGRVNGRKFPVDMAGFAVSVEFFLQRPKAAMAYEAMFQEDTFLRSLAPFEVEDIELKADDCTKILVWHTRTRKSVPPIQPHLANYYNTNIFHLRHSFI